MLSIYSKFYIDVWVQKCTSKVISLPVANLLVTCRWPVSLVWANFRQTVGRQLVDCQWRGAILHNYRELCLPQSPQSLTSRFVPMDLLYPDDLYLGSDISYHFWSVRTQPSGRFVPHKLWDKMFKTNINTYFIYPSNRKKLIITETLKSYLQNRDLVDPS